MIAGILLSSLTLFLDIPLIGEIKKSVGLEYFKLFAVGLLLYRGGLESNIHEFKEGLKKGSAIAFVGVFAPAILVFFALYFLKYDFLTAFAIGAATSATSVAITLKAFKDVGKDDTNEKKKTIVAAVVDDVLGLLILAVLVEYAKTESINPLNIAEITIKTIMLFLAAWGLGKITSKPIGRYFSRIDSGNTAKFILAVIIACLGAAVAHLMGLEEVLGMFAAGLVLDDVHFKKFKKPEYVQELEDIATKVGDTESKRLKAIAKDHSEKHVENMIEGLERFFTPIFLVLVGLSVDITVFFDISILLTSLLVTFLAVVGKLASGYFAGEGVNRKVIGIAMIARGEVGLIFASIIASILPKGGHEASSIVVIMVVLTTLIGPIWLRRMKNKF